MSNGSSSVPVRLVMRAHAKINLLLRILAREASGFHSIETVFQKLALHDVVHVATNASGRLLSCDGPAMPSGGIGAQEDNIAWRAAVAFSNTTRWDTGWDITIEKHIPVGGGLGGGSADAAAVLRAMNALCPHPLDHASLIALGGTLGADVAFFVSEASLAIAWGRGDRLLTLTPLPQMAVTLIAFQNGVDTGQAYAALAQSRAAGMSGTDAYPYASVMYASDAFSSWEHVSAIAANDFEVIVQSMHTSVAVTLPLVRAAAQRVRDSGAPGIGMMSGSGATCFVVHPCSVDVALDVGATAHVVRTETL